MSAASQEPMGLPERALFNLERCPWGALYRVALGYAMLPCLAFVTGSSIAGWSVILWFAAVLVALRVVPAVLRKLLPFSRALSTAWAERRMMAKRFDSYQWRKLFWIGVGLGTYVVHDNQRGWPIVALVLFCLVGGAAGLLIYRRRRGFGNHPRAERN